MQATRRLAESSKTIALVVDGAFGCCEADAAFWSEFGLEMRCVETSDEALDVLTRYGNEIAVVMAGAAALGRMNAVAFARSVAILWPAITVILTSEIVGEPATELPVGVVRLREPWRPLDIVAASERAARADHSVRSLRF